MYLTFVDQFNLSSSVSHHFRVIFSIFLKCVGTQNQMRIIRVTLKIDFFSFTVKHNKHSSSYRPESCFSVMSSLRAQMSGMNRVVATCWTCLLLAAFLCEPVLSKGGRGGSRGSSRGSPSRSSTAGSYRGGGAHGGTRSRFRVAGRTSPVRVAAAAAAGAAVALTADKWYASAYRRSKTDSSEEELDFYNRTNYFDALMSGSTQNGSSLSQLVSIIIATLSPKYGLLLDIIL